MSEHDPALRRAVERALAYLESIGDRPVFPAVDSDRLREGLASQLGDSPMDPATVVDELADALEPGLVSSGGGRYFGFVTGGHLPAALAADWLASAWDQNSFSYVSSPAAAIAEEVAASWLKEVLGLPAGASVGFVTGCQMAHVTCLAAARHEVLLRAGWDVTTSGLAGAPPITILTGALAHATVDRALRLLGIGSESIEKLPVDDGGRLDPEATLRRLDAHQGGPLILVAQAGEVNTGAFDPIDDIAAAVAAADGWLHVDGAFGVWAAASPRFSHLTEGLGRADSWALDAHKWLNVPYDSGVAVCAHPEPHRAAMSYTGEYLIPTAVDRDAADWAPDASRRARGFAVYAALRSLGRTGLADLVERCCDHATRIAGELADWPGVEVLNDVVLNQVLFAHVDDEHTTAWLAAIQRSGETWMGGTTWQGRPAIRLSVSSWATTAGDVERALAAMRVALDDAATTLRQR